MAIAIRQNIISYGMNEKCASVRSIEWLPASLNGDPPEAVEAFVRECIEAIEKDGADVIVVGCNQLLWIQPIAQKRLIELGYEVPILHPYKCAIEIEFNVKKGLETKVKHALIRLLLTELNNNFYSTWKNYCFIKYPVTLNLHEHPY
jgi:Asp/Glu/hydantoin racemase